MVAFYYLIRTIFQKEQVITLTPEIIRFIDTNLFAPDRSDFTKLACFFSVFWPRVRVIQPTVKLDECGELCVAGSYPPMQ
jgi:hypothetical protein